MRNVDDLTFMSGHHFPKGSLDLSHPRRSPLRPDKDSTAKEKGI